MCLQPERPAHTREAAEGLKEGPQQRLCVRTVLMLGMRRQPGLARTCLRRMRCLIPTQSRALKAKGVVTGEPNAPGHRGQGWGLWAPDAGISAVATEHEPVDWTARRSPGAGVGPAGPGAEHCEGRVLRRCSWPELCGLPPAASRAEPAALVPGRLAQVLVGNG